MTEDNQATKARALHAGYVYLFDVEVRINADNAEPQSLVKVGASGENAAPDASELEFWLHALATLSRFKTELVQLTADLSLPMVASHCIAAVRRAYAVWLSRQVALESNLPYPYGRPPSAGTKSVTAPA